MERAITILEDDQDIREICTYLFTSEGYKVSAYGTVSAFCSGNSSPDLYLLDIRLPDGNGLEVCRKLKASPLSAHIPIMMMSAHLDAQTVISECSAEAFIAKPFVLDELVNRAAALISESMGTKSS